MSSDKTWNCPACDHRVSYGQGCPLGYAKTCELGIKNLHWYAGNLHDNTDVKSVGIAEIANKENGV